MIRSNKARRLVILYGLILDGMPVMRRFNTSAGSSIVLTSIHSVFFFQFVQSKQTIFSASLLVFVLFFFQLLLFLFDCLSTMYRVHV